MGDIQEAITSSLSLVGALLFLPPHCEGLARPPPCHCDQGRLCPQRHCEERGERRFTMTIPKDRPSSHTSRETRTSPTVIARSPYFGRRGNLWYLRTVRIGNKGRKERLPRLLPQARNDGFQKGGLAPTVIARRSIFCSDVAISDTQILPLLPTTSLRGAKRRSNLWYLRTVRIGNKGRKERLPRLLPQARNDEDGRVRELALGDCHGSLA